LTRMATIRQERADAHAIELLFREEARALWRALVAFTGGRREVAEDAMSEAFARALHFAEGIRNPKSWIYATAFRLAAQDLRRERRDREGVSPPWREDSRDSDEVMTALRQLPTNQRAAVVLHYYVDLPVREVARVLGIAPATVKVHLFRARRRLRALLGGEESHA
jgi:RNA polymerase sigma-70 factor (ECF subfamily)